jgi:hypothetical protein
METDLKHGFPSGYFIIKSVASNRVLDVAGDAIEDGAEVLLWLEKEKSLVESYRDPEANNQVFYIDTSGALCSRGSGHAIDIKDGKLVLRHRRPMSYPYPNAYSHPLPCFAYSPQTEEISVAFECDPSYPPPSTEPSEAWKNKRYLLTSIPLRKPRTIIDDASEFISTAMKSPFAGLSNMFSVTANNGENNEKENITPAAGPDAVFDGEIDLKEDEIVEEERGEEGEVDDSPDPSRKVAVVGIATTEEEETLSRKAKARMTWKVIPLRRLNARTSCVVVT